MQNLATVGAINVEIRKTGTGKQEDLNADPRYICSECGKLFFYKSKYEQHYRLHTGHKPFACPICGLSFNKKSNLKRHYSCRHGTAE